MMNMGTKSERYIDCIYMGGCCTVKLGKRYKYHDNKSFIMALAQAWDEYPKKDDPISPYRLYHMLAEHDIRTNNGDAYTHNSRGPFNLIRSAYKFAEKKWEISTAMQYDPTLQSDEDKAKIKESIEYWSYIKDCVARAFVNSKGKYAYEC